MKMMRTTTLSELHDFVEVQLAEWPAARERYEALGLTERRLERYGDWPLIVQHNPARAVSTEARTDAASIAARPCFLCAANRPAEQKAIDWPEGWQLLVNPFPVLPFHLVGASKAHQPQEALPVAAIEAALACPGLVTFFNGAKAGASAPDHLHYQAVLASELPLLSHVEKLHRGFGYAYSDELDPDLPMRFISVVADPSDSALMRRVIGARGLNVETGLPDPGMVNTFVWVDAEGRLRALVFPRTRHRPACYFEEGEERIAVSPGALDMVGLFIVPRAQDYARLDRRRIEDIYREVQPSADQIRELWP